MTEIGMTEIGMTEKSILITGCSTGIGLVCARGLKARGWRVLTTARKQEDIARLRQEGFECLELDYRYTASVAACAVKVTSLTQGKLFALFNNGAYGQPGAVEDITRTVLEEQFAANFFGWHELTTLLLPHMRAAGRGRIVQCSSVLGLMAFKYRGPYTASKFALEGLTDTLRLELRGTNIKVITINPGPIESNFVPNASAAFARNVDMTKSFHRAAFVRQQARLESGGNNRFKLPAQAVLAQLIKAVEHKSPRAHYYVTTPTWLVAAARRILPQSLIDLFAASNSD
jgi:NAD(P)-dependent dehydrogenase (short-subunit alcohol dehydrogenase family)